MQRKRHALTYKLGINKWKSYFYGHKFFLFTAILSSLVFPAVCVCKRMIASAEKPMQVRVSCLKCVACCLRRLTQNHSAADTLSLTKSSAKQERKISHLRCQDAVPNILSYACLFDEHLRLCDDMRLRWLDSQTDVELEYISQAEITSAVFPNQVN